MARSDQAQADERQIRALLQARLGALRAKDASQFVAAYDMSIVKFDLAPPLQERFCRARPCWSPVVAEYLGRRAHGRPSRTEHHRRLRKIDDAWKITHEHNSAPFYMDGSGRPALDLLP